MADQQPTGVEEGDIPLTASHPSPSSHPSPPSTGQDAPNGGVQQEKTAQSDSDSDLFLSTELSLSGKNEDHLLLVLLILTPFEHNYRS